MLDRADRNQPLLHCGSCTLDEKVVGFRAAAGKDHFSRMRADCRRHPTTCVVDCSPCLAPVLMTTGGIAKARTQPGQHGFQHFRIKRCAGIPVEVDRRKHGVHPLRPPLPHAAKWLHDDVHP
ncbi:hypothetical protein SDC9_177314 [bioreactor metagenome]|uniref:Uncharacterized protein n=1 Tax=bioreactor metagenome TaxID=1076179 RepID=A0A645GSN1_9ZZZZ